jgi:hypothetical protein
MKLESLKSSKFEAIPKNALKNIYGGATGECTRSGANNAPSSPLQGGGTMTKSYSSDDIDSNGNVDGRYGLSDVTLTEARSII